MSNAAVLHRFEILPATASRRFYRPELDCVRFFAFIAVYVFHIVPYEAGFYAQRHISLGVLIASAARAGSFGVDLFFLLSAYLITELLLQEKEQFGSVHLRSFYARRILRIWPLYFLAVLIAALLPLVDPTQKFPLPYVVAFLMLSGNWLTSLVGFPGSVMNPLWSVSFEEQFYVVWPALIWRVRRAKTLLVASGFMLVVAQIARIVLLKYARHSEVAIFTNTLARLDPVAFGSATAVLLHKRRIELSWFIRLSCSIAAITIWLLAGRFFGMTVAFMIIGYPAMAVGSWLIFLATFELRFSPQWLRYLGKISYGLYVFHILAFHLVEKLMGGYAKSWGYFVICFWLGLGLTIAMAALSYRYLESPFLRLKDRLAFIRSRPV